EAARPPEPAPAVVAPEPPKAAAPERKAPAPPPVVTAVDPAPRRENPPTAGPTDGAANGAVASAAPAAARRFGGVTFVSPLELQVSEGGTRIGSSGASIAVLEGVHTFDLVNDTLGFHSRDTVTIKPGELASRTVAVPNGRISVNAMPWAEVLID